MFSFFASPAAPAPALDSNSVAVADAPEEFRIAPMPDAAAAKLHWAVAHLDVTQAPTEALRIVEQFEAHSREVAIRLRNQFDGLLRQKQKHDLERRERAQFDGPPVPTADEVASARCALRDLENRHNVESRRVCDQEQCVASIKRGINVEQQKAIRNHGDDGGRIKSLEGNLASAQAELARRVAVRDDLAGKMANARDIINRGSR